MGPRTPYKARTSTSCEVSPVEGRRVPPQGPEPDRETYSLVVSLCLLFLSSRAALKSQSRCDIILFLWGGHWGWSAGSFGFRLKCRRCKLFSMWTPTDPLLLLAGSCGFLCGETCLKNENDLTLKYLTVLPSSQPCSSIRHQSNQHNSIYTSRLSFQFTKIVSEWKNVWGSNHQYRFKSFKSLNVGCDF